MAFTLIDAARVVAAPVVALVAAKYVIAAGLDWFWAAAAGVGGATVGWYVGPVLPLLPFLPWMLRDPELRRGLLRWGRRAKP